MRGPDSCPLEARYRGYNRRELLYDGEISTLIG